MDLWDRVDLLVHQFEMCSACTTQEQLALKSHDMAQTLGKFKERLEKTISYMESCEIEGDELWSTFRKDMEDTCSLLKASMRTTYVDKIRCMDVDSLAINLFITTKDILRDWADDFYGDDFEVDTREVWFSYFNVVSALSLFCDTRECEESLRLQYKNNIKPKTEECKRSSFKEKIVKKSKNKVTLQQKKTRGRE